MSKVMKMKILTNESIAKKVFRMKLSAEEVDFKTLSPGTFLNIRVGKGMEPLLRRPISIFDADEKEKNLTIIYKVMGRGTDLMSFLKEGENLDVLGPLGTGFPVQDESRKVLLAGGGVGVPPLYELGKRLRENGVEVVTVLGFKDEASVFCQEDFLKLGKVWIATEDGSVGVKGYVTDAIREMGEDFDTLYACGPRAMLRSLDEAYQDTKKGYLSFEEGMACGIGACYGCMTETKDGLKRVCKDGPVFRLGEVVYE